MIRTVCTSISFYYQPSSIELSVAACDYYFGRSLKYGRVIVVCKSQIVNVLNISIRSFANPAEQLNPLVVPVGITKERHALRCMPLVYKEIPQGELRENKKDTFQYLQ